MRKRWFQTWPLVKVEFILFEMHLYPNNKPNQEDTSLLPQFSISVRLHKYTSNYSNNCSLMSCIHNLPA
jgi:hypothetical protein